MLQGCLSEDTRKFIPDDVSLGTQLFFLAQTQIHAKQYEDAHISLQECATTHWADNKHNSYILHFSLAKLYQSQGMHEEAIPVFNKAIDLSEGLSHGYFRRAWSYKVHIIADASALCMLRLILFIRCSVMFAAHYGHFRNTRV